MFVLGFAWILSVHVNVKLCIVDSETGFPASDGCTSDSEDVLIGQLNHTIKIVTAGAKTCSRRFTKQVQR